MDRISLLSWYLEVFDVFEIHTAEYIQRRLAEIFEECCIFIEIVTGIVTDKSIKVNRDMVPCFAHMVKLVVPHSLSKATVIIGHLVAEIVKYIKLRVNANDELYTKQKDQAMKKVTNP